MICTLICCDRIPDQTIAGERKLLKQWCEKFLADKVELYNLIYESRFDRLIAQFRGEAVSGETNRAPGRT